MPIHKPLQFFISSDFSFLSIRHGFSKTYEKLILKECIITLKLRQTSHAILLKSTFEMTACKVQKNCHAIFQKNVLAKLCLIDRKLEFDEMKNCCG